MKKSPRHVPQKAKQMFQYYFYMLQKILESCWRLWRKTRFLLMINCHNVMIVPQLLTVAISDQSGILILISYAWYSPHRTVWRVLQKQSSQTLKLHCSLFCLQHCLSHTVYSAITSSGFIVSHTPCTNHSTHIMQDIDAQTIKMNNALFFMYISAKYQLYIHLSPAGERRARDLQ